MLADRFPCRALLVAVNLLSAALVLPIGLVDGRGGMWVIDVVIFWYGAAGAVIAEIDARTFLVAVVSLFLLQMPPAPVAGGAAVDGVAPSSGGPRRR